MRRPVSAETTERPWRDLIWFPFMVGLYLALMYLIVLFRWTSDWDDIHLAGNISLMTLTIITFIIFLIVVPQIAIQVLATSVVLETDGLYMMRGDRVVISMRFGRKVGVEIALPEDLTEVGIENVEGFVFSKGLRSIRFSVGREDTARFWPVVEAAAWKHRMVLGENIEKMLMGRSEDNAQG